MSKKGKKFENLLTEFMQLHKIIYGVHVGTTVTHKQCMLE